MKTLYITIDDFRSLSLTPLFFKWKELSPNLKLTLFVTPCWKGKTDIRRAGTFKTFVETTSDWIEFAGHGFDHSFPPECTRKLEDQRKMFSNCKQFLSEVGIDNPGFKPPGYHFTLNSLAAFRDHFTYFVTQDRITSNTELKPIPNPPGLIGFHAEAKWLHDSLTREDVKANLEKIIKESSSFATLKDWIRNA